MFNAERGSKTESDEGDLTAVILAQVDEGLSTITSSFDGELALPL